MLVIRAFRKAFLPSKWFDAAVQGVKASGDDCEYADDLNTPCDIAMHTSGVKAIKGPIVDARRFLVEKYDWRRLVIESRCFRENQRGGEEKYWRISLGGFLDDEAIYHPPEFVADSLRWEMIRKEQEITLKPWRGDGEHVLLCGQKPSDASLRGQNVDEWFIQTTILLCTYTDRPIIWRPHPLDHGGAHRLKSLAAVHFAENEASISKNPKLENDLNKAWAMVTFTSLSSIEAACAGVPIFVMNSGSLAASVANRDLSRIENPAIFDRRPWLWDLAYRQWKVSELREGHPWRRLRKAYFARIGDDQ